MHPAARPELGDIYVKTGMLKGHDFHVVKMAPWFAANVANGIPQGGFLALLDSASGHTRAIFTDQHYLSDIRTAAAGALAARLFAPETVQRATVVGAGVQAFWQTLALYRERTFTHLTLWARDSSKSLLLARRLEIRLPEVTIEVANAIESAIQSADVVITTTSARQPLVRGDWLRPGQHVTAVGADDANKCELDATVLNRARVFVDARDAAAENGDVHHAILAGSYRLNQLAGEIGEVLSGRIAGRTSPSDITVAKFVGLGAQDLVAAEIALYKLPAASTPVVHPATDITSRPSLPLGPGD